MNTTKDAYESCADMMMETMAVQLGGASRPQVLGALKAKFPVEADLVAYVQTLEAQANVLMAQAQAKLQPGESLGIAYPIGPISGAKLH